MNSQGLGRPATKAAMPAAVGFRTFHKSRRVRAEALKRVIDPAECAEDLSDVGAWSYTLTGSDQDEVRAAVDAVRRNRIAVTTIGRDHFPLQGFAAILADVRRELQDGRGIVMLQNFPIDMDREAIAIAYLGMGSHLGHPISQNKAGHILGHVKDLGGDYAAPNTRGYMTRAEMRFHTDPCDYVGLLCLQKSKTGGASCIASSVAVYNCMLERHPDLARVLTEDFYRSRSGEINPGEAPWFKQPIFSFTDGYFSCSGIGMAVEKAQGLPGVPPYTEVQKEAVRVYKETVDECAMEIGFRPGDVQFLNNHVMLHTRREYEDWPEPARKRHLLRLWLNDPGGRPIPREQREGRLSGVSVEGVVLSVPLDVDALE
jgi:Taurine catabolism dioxygenase TauD, TfdA family